MTGNPPLCKDCIHFQKAKIYFPFQFKADPKLHKCMRAVEYIPDLVEGKTTILDINTVKYCMLERDKNFENLNTCGPMGKYFST